MKRQQRIEKTLQQALLPSYLEVHNETHKHNVPEDAESHYKVTIVSGQFDGLPLIQRQRQVNTLLKDEFSSGVHALALHTFTPDEWRDRKARPTDSPPCLGGGRT